MDSEGLTIQNEQKRRKEGKYEGSGKERQDAGSRKGRY